jgi:hypothetical protein
VAVNLPDPLTLNSGAIIEGTVVYNTATSSDQTSDVAVNPGLYYWGGAYNATSKKGGWIKLQYANSSKSWFYMPSIVIDVSADGTYQRDLYLEYRKQFEDTGNFITNILSPKDGTALVKSETAAPNPFTRIFASNELYYYIIGYDADVFSAVTVSNVGLLQYTVDADNVTDATYMNIVFMVK